MVFEKLADLYTLFQALFHRATRDEVDSTKEGVSALQEKLENIQLHALVYNLQKLQLTLSQHLQLIIWFLDNDLLPENSMKVPTAKLHEVALSRRQALIQYYKDKESR